ncbi:MAG TPA: hypothetical protein VEP66_21840 [Myxococcales bacterium]|nr:hypothetical protein [Myxococcales bacterium]
MTTRKFTARLSCPGDQNDRATYSVHLVPVGTRVQDESRYSIFDQVPFHPAAEVTSGTAADCHLQLWELDYYRVQSYMQDEETDSAEHENQRVVSIPGIVVKTGSNSFKFQATADAEGGTVDPKNGKVNLSLDRIGQSAADLTVAMPAYESVFELYPILKTQAEDQAVQSYHDASSYIVKNIEATLRRQIEERGGIAVAFVLDQDNPEFPRQAEELIATVPTFKVEDGEVKMGFHLWSSYSVLESKLPELREKVKDLLGLDEPPLISVLEMYGHGIRQKLKINSEGYNAEGSLRVDRVPDFVEKVKPHLCSAPVIPLFACNTGAGASPNTDAQTRYGQPYPCEELGADGLAWTLFRELVRQGIPNPTIWAHMNAAHTTRNARLRAFSIFGTADLSSLLFEMPPPTQATIDSYLRVCRTLSSEQFRANPAEGRTHVHNANLIRRISLQHAMYLPWRWSGRDGGDSSTPGYNEAARAEAGAVFEEIRSLVENPEAMQDDLVYEDDTRAFITGLRDGLDNARLSQNFSYSEIRNLADPMRVSVTLLKMLQLLRYRSNKGLTPQALFDNGVGLAVRVQPDTAQARHAVLNKANDMVTEGLLASAIEESGLIKIAVS